MTDYNLAALLILALLGLWSAHRARNAEHRDAVNRRVRTYQREIDS